MCKIFALLSSTTPTVVGPDAWASLITKLTDQISVATIVTVLGSIAGISIGIVFMWWGVRKVIRVLMGAFRKGKLSV